MKKINLFLPLIILVGILNVSAMEKNEKESEGTLSVNTINDIPRYCVHLVKMLSGQPVVSGRARKQKILSLEDSDDPRICEILNKNANRISGKIAWDIGSFGPHNGFLDESNKFISQGIRLYLSDNEELCSYEELAERYKTIIALVQDKWRSATLQEYPDIFLKNDEETWNLFIKKKELKEEDTLIRFLAGKFDMSSSVECDDKWAKHGFEHRAEIYLWVQKSAMHQFATHFNFKGIPYE